MALLDLALAQEKVTFVSVDEDGVSETDLIDLDLINSDTIVYYGNGPVNLNDLVGVGAVSSNYIVASGGADVTLDAGLLDLKLLKFNNFVIDGSSSFTFSAGSISALSALTNLLNGITIGFSGSGDGVFTYEPPTVNLVSAVTINITDMGPGDKIVVPIAGNGIGGIYALREVSYNASTQTLTLQNGGGLLTQSVTVNIRMSPEDYAKFSENKGQYLNGNEDSFVYPGDDSHLPPDGVPCFASGCLIETADGPMPVEDLEVGMKVLTYDGDFKTIRWIGRRTLSKLDLLKSPNMYPVRVRKGALGVGLPSQDILLSPQHRLMVKNAVVNDVVETDEALAAVKHLTDFPGIHVDESVREVTYHHFIFDCHAVVIANGVPAESLYPGRVALSSISDEAREELFSLFRELREEDFAFAPSRPFVKGKDARKIATLSVANGESLYVSAC